MSVQRYFSYIVLVENHQSATSNLETFITWNNDLGLGGFRHHFYLSSCRDRHPSHQCVLGVVTYSIHERCFHTPEIVALNFKNISCTTINRLLNRVLNCCSWEKATNSFRISLVEENGSYRFKKLSWIFSDSTWPSTWFEFCVDNMAAFCVDEISDIFWLKQTLHK